MKQNKPFSGEPKVGDLVSVGLSEIKTEFVSIVLALCEPEEHMNGMRMVKVVERGQSRWYPIGYIRVINENESG